jgi:hypothetical protein
MLRLRYFEVRNFGSYRLTSISYGHISWAFITGTVRSAHLTVRNSHHAIHRVQFTLHGLQHTIHSAQFTMRTLGRMI